MTDEDELIRLRRENTDYKRLFEMQWQRMQEATDRWRAEDPDTRNLVSPDLGKLLTWLLDKIDQGEVFDTWEIYVASDGDVYGACPSCGDLVDVGSRPTVGELRTAVQGHQHPGAVHPHRTDGDGS